MSTLSHKRGGLLAYPDIHVSEGPKVRLSDLQGKNFYPPSHLFRQIYIFNMISESPDFSSTMKIRIGIILCVCVLVGG